jgi:hypothetical protein
LIAREARVQQPLLDSFDACPMVRVGGQPERTQRSARNSDFLTVPRRKVGIELDLLPTLHVVEHEHLPFIHDS